MILQINYIECGDSDCCNFRNGYCVALAKEFVGKCPFYKSREENERQLKRLAEKEKQK